ncbi:hypothetical protein Tco_0868258 [Tanacetum coccineum]
MIFGNMRRVGKGFSGRETPLFQTMMVQDQEEVGEGSEMPTDPHHTHTIIQPSISQPQKKQRSRRSKRKDTKVPHPSGPTTNVADEAVNEDMDDSIERDATTATGLDSEQGTGNINKTRSKATLNEPSSSGTSSGSGPRCQETMGDTISQTRFENISKLSNDPLLARGNTLRSGEDSLKLEELMALCTTLQSRVLDLETTKTTQATEIAKSSKHEVLDEDDASKQGRIADINANEDIYLVNVRTDEDMFGVNDLDGDEVIVKSVDVVKTAEETRSVVEEVIVVTIPVSATTTTTTTTAITDVEMTLAQALAELKSAKPKATTITTTPTLATTTTATTITAVKVQDKGKGKMVKPEPVKKMSKKELLRLDEELVFKLQAEEEEEEERLAREKAQQMEEANIAWDDVQAKIDDGNPKNKSFANIQELFDKAMKRVNTFVDYRTELVEESSKKEEAEIANESSLKRAREELEQESSKKADGKTQMYLTFGTMLKNFDREDLEVLWSIVKARFKKIEPVNYMDNFLLLNLKTMFEHHVEDNVWKNQQGLVKVLNWKLYDSCGVHCVTMQNMLFYLLVQKIYPLTNHILQQMFNDVKLQVDYESEMTFELPRLVKKQLKEGYVPE